MQQFKKTLFISIMNGAAWGGSEELWYQSALWMAAQGEAPAICCFDWPEKRDRIEKLTQAGCEIFLLPGNKIARTVIGRLRLRVALRRVPFTKYDLVIVNQGGWKDVTHAPFRKLYRTLPAYILLYHNYDINERVKKRRRSSLQAWIKNAEKNLGATIRIFEAIEKNYRFPVNHSGVLLNPLSFERSTVLTEYPPLEEPYIFAVFAALDIERKAQDVLIRTMTDNKWETRNWQLYFFGSGKDQSYLQHLIDDLKLTDRIFLMGNAVNYKAAMEASHLVLQITHFDAMPITVMDAISLGRPVIVSDVGDMPVWVRANENGWVVGDVTAENINLTLEEAWADRESWRAMGATSFQIFNREFPIHPINHFLEQAGILH